MSSYQALALAYDLAMVGVGLVAVCFGSRTERLGIAAIIAASVASSLVRMTHVASWAPSGLIVLAIDLSVAASFFFLAIRTTRFWPIWALGFALADIFVSAAGSLLPRWVWFAYESGVGAYAYLTLLVVTLGSTVDRAVRTSAMVEEVGNVARLSERVDRCPAGSAESDR